MLTAGVYVPAYHDLGTNQRTHTIAPTQRLSRGRPGAAPGHLGGMAQPTCGVNPACCATKGIVAPDITFSCQQGVYCSGVPFTDDNWKYGEETLRDLCSSDPKCLGYDLKREPSVIGRLCYDKTPGSDAGLSCTGAATGSGSKDGWAG